jgi:glycosyltransferase involved in cell wall biosynthesis
MIATNATNAGGPEDASLVSVVIIFLNEMRFLREAVESVLAQDYTTWELLLVDDGSTDASAELARAFARQDGRIHYLAHPRHENRGMSASRNLGLSNASGEYVTFLDADDVYLPSRLRRHVEILDHQPGVAMVVSDHVRWLTDDSGSANTAEIPSTRPFFVAGDQIWKPLLGLMVVMAVPYLALGICNVTVRRQVALQVGGFEDSFRSMYEDQVFTSKILARHSVYVLPAYLARYRHHSQSWTRKTKAAGEFHDRLAHPDTTRFADWLLAHLEQQGIDDPLVHSMVERRRLHARAQAGGLDTIRMRFTALAKRQLERILPRSWHRRLVLLDYELDLRRARRDYQRLMMLLSKRALSAVHDGKAL